MSLRWEAKFVLAEFMRGTHSAICLAFGPTPNPLAPPWPLRCAQVEMLSRVMRKWDEDGVPDPESIAFGEFILRVSKHV